MGETITGAVENLFTLTTNVIDFVTKNPVLAICFVAGTIIPAGIAIFNRLKTK